jgi:broad specificity phosphatase PhoE
MSSLLFLRHGQASFGAADYDRLTPLGERQAKEAGAYLARIGARFDAVLIGPRQRHLGTANAVLGQLPQCPAPSTVVSLDEFAEATEVMEAAEKACGFTPVEMAALPQAEQLRHYEAAIRAWMEGRAHIRGRPSAEAFRTQVAHWLREVRARPGRGENILAVTSAGTIAAVVAEVLDLPVDHMGHFTSVLRNTSLTEIVFSSKRISLMSFNCVSHLPPELASGM